MASSRNKNTGILFIILGSILLVLFSGHFIMPIIGIVIGITLINHGLYLLNYPPLWTLAQDWLANIRFK
jgi:hypothetical protein